MSAATAINRRPGTTRLVTCSVRRPSTPSALGIFIHFANDEDHPANLGRVSCAGEAAAQSVR